MYLNFTVGDGPTALQVDIKRLGKDLVVCLQGGKGHIGSIAVGIPRPSLADPSVCSSTTSVFNLTGHKDEQLTSPIAATLAARTGQVVTVVAGFHLDGISPQELKQVLKNRDQALRLIISHIEGSDQQRTDCNLLRATDNPGDLKK